MDSGKKALLIIVFIGFVEGLFAQNDSVFSSKVLSSFRLYDAAAGKTSFPGIAISQSPFSLFIFLSPECPLSQNYLPLFNRLKKTYSDRVTFYGIIPGKAYSSKVVRTFAATYNIQFPLLVDSSKSFTNYMHATVTPEVILINDKNVLIYRGAIDDLAMGLGKRRIKTTNEYLKNAIVQSLENKTVDLKRTRAVGCKINDY